MNPFHVAFECTFCLLMISYQQY